MKRKILLMGLTLSLLGASSVMANLQCPTADEFVIQDLRGDVIISGERKIGNMLVGWGGTLDRIYHEDKVISVTKDNLSCILKIHSDDGEDYEGKVELQFIKGIAPSSEALAPFAPEIIEAFDDGKTPSPIVLNGYTWKITRTNGHLQKDSPITIVPMGGGQYAPTTNESGYISSRYDFYAHNVTVPLSLTLQALVFPNKIE